MTLLLCRTWKSRLYRQHAPLNRARYKRCMDAVSSTCKNKIYWERGPLSLGFFPPIEDLSLAPDYTTQLGTEFWWAEWGWGGDKGRMFTAHFHFSWLEAIEALLSTVHTELKGWEMCHQVILTNRPFRYSHCYKDVMHVVFPLAPLKASHPFIFSWALTHGSPCTLQNPPLGNIMDDGKYCWV